MRFVLIVLITLHFSACGSKHNDAPYNPDLTPLGNFDQSPMPAWETDAERQLRKDKVLKHALRFTDLPDGFITTPPEYSKTDGVVISIPNYSISNPYFKYLIHGVHLANATPYLLVWDDYTKKIVERDMLKPRGLTTNDVQFIESKINTIWSRDYGPWSIFLDGQRQFVDMHYYFGRPYDDQVPIFLSEYWEHDVYSASLYTEGGNFMTDGLSTCWTSYGTLWRNSITELELKSLYKNYLNCDLVLIPPLPGEGTTHIDMFSKILDQDTIMVAYSTTDIGATRDQVETLERAAELYRYSPKATGGEWNIVRIPMSFGLEYDEQVFYSHTNSLIVNNVVLVPIYNIATDDKALEVYRNAMPQHDVIGVNSMPVITSGGAIHCTTMQISQKLFNTCGDGVILQPEQCEANYYRGHTCQSLGYEGGVLSCNSQCQWDTSFCEGRAKTLCGNSIVEENEVCDDQSISCSELSASYTSGWAFCNDDCTGYVKDNCEQVQPVCNNGQTEGTEICDMNSIACSKIDAQYTNGIALCDSDCLSWDITNCVKQNEDNLIVSTIKDTISQGEWHEIAPLRVGSGLFHATLTPTSNVDLFIKLGSTPNHENADCAPSLAEAQTETCELDGPGYFFIALFGNDEVADYKLTLEYYPE